MSRQITTQKNLPQALTDPHRRRLPPLLRSAWFSLNQAFRRRIAHMGLTPNQFTVLRWLHEHQPKGLMQRELAELMVSDANTMVALLGRMEQAGWITREIHEADRRKHLIQLKTSGEALFLEARTVAMALQKRALSAIPPAKQDEFLGHLAAIAELCISLD